MAAVSSSTTERMCKIVSAVNQALLTPRYKSCLPLRVTVKTSCILGRPRYLHVGPVHLQDTRLSRGLTLQPLCLLHTNQTPEASGSKYPQGATRETSEQLLLHG